MTARKVQALLLVAGIAFGAAFTGTTSSVLAAKVKQPAMEAALTHLQKAKRKLQNAGGDAGGHRQKAIDLTGQAIAEVQQAIAAEAK